MGKYRRYKNRIEMFLSSDMGKRVLNFCYSWGASIVILGALFKLLHLPYANQILGVAMVVESLVFFISAFEHPGKEYHWEEVFPVLKSKNPMDRPDFSFVSGNKKPSESETTADAATNITMVGGVTGGTGTGLNLGLDVSEEATKNLSESIKKLSGAADQLSKMAELTDATQKYLDQLAGMADNMERFSKVTSSLTDVSDTLLNSYKCITDNSDDISGNSRGYVQQMETLNRNLSGLNSVYEMQLKGISSQIDSIENINHGLNRIRGLYESSVVDSSVFKAETEKMAQQLSQLNQVYGRLLQAMTVNMYGAPAAQAPQQPVYQQNPYTQQPPMPHGNPYPQQGPYGNNQQG
ncbi:MAG: gliding motility protein GldL [Tannerellaceae bacterium]|nr:gliding motility protein GldL [Tannerellaceae bacterium]